MLWWQCIPSYFGYFEVVLLSLLTSLVGFQLSLHLISPTKTTCASFPRVPKSETSVCNLSYPLVTGRDQRQEKIKHSHSHQHQKYSSPMGPIIPSGCDVMWWDWRGMALCYQRDWGDTGQGVEMEAASVLPTLFSWKFYVTRGGLLYRGSKNEGYLIFQAFFSFKW